MTGNVFARNQNTRSSKSTERKHAGCRNNIVGSDNCEVVAAVFDTDVGNKTGESLGQSSHRNS